ncbi:MAG: acyltransferase [Microbacteriaceae bacterium]|jgi:acyltransferase|nr:acyltransferase [Microbacteriaceae bacterium]
MSSGCRAGGTSEIPQSRLDGAARPVQHGARSASLDALRVFAMLAVVAGHIWVHGAARPFLYSWHVPIFFVLSGYLWKQGRPFNTEVKNRFDSLLLPYFAWLLILGSIASWSESSDGRFTPTRFLHILWGGDFATGSPFWAMWFVTALFFAAVVYWPISQLPLPWQWAIAAALLVVAVYIPEQPVRFLPLSLGLAFPGIVFIVAGQTLRHFSATLRFPTVVGGGLLAVSFAVIVLRWSEPLDLKRLDVGTPIASVALAIALSVGFILVAQGLLGDGPARIDVRAAAGAGRAHVGGVIGRLPRVATALAKASLTVLFIHPAVITVVQSLGLSRPLVFVITIGTAWAIGLLLLRIPHSRTLTGVKPAR